jgi:lantibiotic modifying enzyme
MESTTIASAPKTSSVQWVPILGEAERQEVDPVFASVAKALAGSDFVKMYGRSLANGSAGVALLFAYLAKAHPESSWRENAAEWLADAAVDPFPPMQGNAFYGGSAGIAWTIQHLDTQASLRVETDPRDVIDQQVLGELAERPWRKDYDLVSGLVGYGVYAMERLSHPIGREILERVVLQLRELSTTSQGGATWWTPPELLPDWQRERDPEGYFNLGLAHGVPAVIALLGQACAADIAVSTSRPLLDAAVEWLLAQHQPDTAGSCFANAVPFGARSTPVESSRIAWCYGDLGLSAALYWAAVTVGEERWKQRALDIARRAAGRPVERAGVVDAGLCHGAAGVAHIFNRFYQATGELLFRDAARRWFGKTMGFYQKSASMLGGFPVWSGGDKEDKTGPEAWSYVPGLLTGPAGVGLALLGAISSVEPAWDRLLLVSIPPRQI